MCHFTFRRLAGTTDALHCYYLASGSWFCGFPPLVTAARHPPRQETRFHNLACDWLLSSEGFFGDERKKQQSAGGGLLWTFLIG